MTAGIALGRFADTPSMPLGTLPANEWSAIEIPPDDGVEPWRATLVASGRVRVCPLS